MFRLLGIFIGSATSIAIILLITGIPEFHLENPELDQKRFDEAVEKLMARKLDPEPLQAAGADVTEEPSDVENGNHGKDVSVQAPVAIESLEPAAAAQEIVHDDALTVVEYPPNDPQWYSFWNPFRSELAANGFVSQLEKVTGLDYRVVRVKTGVYEVAFAYLDDEERRFKLSQISAATGLDLPDS